MHSPDTAWWAMTLPGAATTPPPCECERQWPPASPAVREPIDPYFAEHAPAPTFKEASNG